MRITVLGSPRNGGRQVITRRQCRYLVVRCNPVRNDLRLVAFRRSEHIRAVQKNPGRGVQLPQVDFERGQGHVEVCAQH